MKNQIFKVIDKKNEIYINSFIAIDEKIAIEQIKNDIKKTKYLYDNTKDINQKAQINIWFNLAKDYELLNENNKTLLKYSSLIEIKEDKK